MKQFELDHEVWRTKYEARNIAFHDQGAKLKKHCGKVLLQPEMNDYLSKHNERTPKKTAQTFRATIVHTPIF